MQRLHLRGGATVRNERPRGHPRVRARRHDEAGGRRARDAGGGARGAPSACVSARWPRPTAGDGSSTMVRADYEAGTSYLAHRSRGRSRPSSARPRALGRQGGPACTRASSSGGGDGGRRPGRLSTGRRAGGHARLRCACVSVGRGSTPPRRGVPVSRGRGLRRARGRLPCGTRCSRRSRRRSSRSRVTCRRSRRGAWRRRRPEVTLFPRPLARRRAPGRRRAAKLGLGDEQSSVVRRAAQLGLGRIGVPNRVWDKPGPLTTAEWEQVRLHAYHTERVLVRSLCSPQRRSSQDASRAAGRRRLPPRRHGGVDPPRRPPPRSCGRLPGPHGAAPASRGGRARAGRDGGRGDGRGRSARSGGRERVRDAAGVALRRGRTSAPWPAGLTDREVEVLRLLARGLSKKGGSRGSSSSRRAPCTRTPCTSTRSWASRRGPGSPCSRWSTASCDPDRPPREIHRTMDTAGPRVVLA